MRMASSASSARGSTGAPSWTSTCSRTRLEYWGPAGMVFFRNVQVRYMPIQGDTRLTLAVERPGASGDAGVLADRIELQNVKGRSPIPDFTGEYRFGGSRGYFEVAGILGRMSWDDMLADQFELSGDATRWGINLSSNVKLGSAHDPSVAICVRRGHPELHERCPRRCRHRPQSRKCRHADRRQGYSHYRNGVLRRPQLERPLVDFSGLFGHVHRQPRRAGRQRV